MSATEFIEKIAELIPPRAMLTAPDLMAGYLVDWTGNFHGDALAVVRPSSTEEVCLIMDLCTDHQVSLTVQGGNTGLVGGSVPRLSGSEAHSKDQVTSSTESDSVDILLSTTYLCSFEDFDSISGHVTVGAGVTLVQLHEFARTHDLEFGVDLAARDSATVGGMVATNAGGIHVVAHGMMRKQVVGVEAVLPSGEVISTLRGLAKDNTGYDFTQLLCGSEGTLAVITKVRVQLRRPEAVQLLVFGVDSISAALKIASGFIGNIHAAEIVDRASIDCVKRVTGTAVPFDSVFHLLLEVRDELNSDSLATWDNLVVAVDATDREKLWSLRERVTESLAVESAGVVHKLDVSVPQVVLSEAYSTLCGLLERPGAGQVAIFGHLLDGNFHIFFTTESENHGIDLEVLELISSLGGSISAEHGIGRMKAEYLHLSRSEAEIAVMRAVKGAIDPLGIMNPGVLFI